MYNPQDSMTTTLVRDSMTTTLVQSVLDYGQTTGSPFSMTTMVPTAATPLSGAPFTINFAVGKWDTQIDAADPEMLVRQFDNANPQAMLKDTASPHACDMGEQADQNACLNVEGRSCMWTRVETRNPLQRIQASNSFCLPCRIDKQAIPCWNIGAWVDGKQVTNCEMSCDHQEEVIQKNYVCSDTSGAISQNECFAKGSATGSKCMFMSYEVSGGTKSSCAPCELVGTGSWGCPAVGQPGPDADSKVQSCLSQCDVLCAGPPACPPTVAPPPPPPPPSPGVNKVHAAEDEMVSAPFPGRVATTANPWSAIQSARDVATRAGMPMGTTTAFPKVYYPVVYYRSSMDNIFTTGPPPREGAEPPLPQIAPEPQWMGGSFATSLLQIKKAPPLAPQLAAQQSVETPMRRLRLRARRI